MATNGARKGELNSAPLPGSATNGTNVPQHLQPQSPEGALAYWKQAQ